MKVTFVTCSSTVDAQEWDSLVVRFKGGLFHCHAHAIYSARLSQSQPLFLKVCDDGGECVGLAVGTLSSSRIWPFSRHCKQAIFPALPLSRDGNTDDDRAVLSAVEHELKRRGAFTISTSSYDSSNSRPVLSALGYQTETRSEFIIDLTQDLEAIWKSFDGSRRTDVRRAEKLDVKTRQMNTNEGLELVYHFHAKAMERRGIETGKETRAISLAKEHLLETGRAIILSSFREDEPLCAAMFGRFSDVAYYLISGSSVEGNRNRAPVHMLWTAIKRFKEDGCVVFNMGGAREDELGLHRFKRDFGSKILSEPRGRKILSTFGAVLNAVRPQRLLRRRQPSKE